MYDRVINSQNEFLIEFRGFNKWLQKRFILKHVGRSKFIVLKYCDVTCNGHVKLSLMCQLKSLINGNWVKLILYLLSCIHRMCPYQQWYICHFLNWRSYLWCHRFYCSAALVVIATIIRRLISPPLNQAHTRQRIIYLNLAKMAKTTDFSHENYEL